jgi:hypothetical protein
MLALLFSQQPLQFGMAQGMMDRLTIKGLRDD